MPCVAIRFSDESHVVFGVITAEFCVSTQERQEQREYAEDETDVIDMSDHDDDDDDNSSTASAVIDHLEEVLQGIVRDEAMLQKESMDEIIRQQRRQSAQLDALMALIPTVISQQQMVGVSSAHSNTISSTLPSATMVTDLTTPRDLPPRLSVISPPQKK